MALYDCFMYFDEDMLLDIRLNTLNNIVDKFELESYEKTIIDNLSSNIADRIIFAISEMN